MLRVAIVEHQNVARGSFAIHLDFDIYHPPTCGWSGYKEVSDEMAVWCRERWGPSVSESVIYREDADGRLRMVGQPFQALWMLCGKALYVRDLDQAVEARLRWHGAVK